jgi:hypothetical protein
MLSLAVAAALAGCNKQDAAAPAADAAKPATTAPTPARSR